MMTCTLQRAMALSLFAVAAILGTSQLAAAQLFFGQGSWVSDSGNVSGTWRGTIDVAGEDLSGDLTLTGIPDLTEAKIDGTWHPGVIDFARIQAQSEVATITGTITDPSVAGTFTMPVGAGVTGTWQGQITLMADDVTPTPIVDDPAADNTPNPDELTPEELAALADIEQSAQPDAATPTPAPAPTDLPTPGAPDATPTPAT